MASRHPHETTGRRPPADTPRPAGLLAGQPVGDRRPEPLPILTPRHPRTDQANASALAPPDQTDAASTLPSQLLTVEALRRPLESALAARVSSGGRARRRLRASGGQAPSAADQAAGPRLPRLDGRACAAPQGGRRDHERRPRSAAPTQTQAERRGPAAPRGTCVALATGLLSSRNSFLDTKPPQKSAWLTALRFLGRHDIPVRSCLHRSSNTPLRADSARAARYARVLVVRSPVPR